MKMIFPVAITAILLCGCGGGGGDGGTITNISNNNDYNITKVLLTDNATALLNGSYSTGVTGSMLVTFANAGQGYVNGIETTNIETNTSLSLNNGNTSQLSAISKRNNYGIMLEGLRDDGVTCTLTSVPYTISPSLKVGASSPNDLIYSCTDSTFITLTWSLTNATNGNANFVQTSSTTGAENINSITTITIDENSNPIYYKIDVNNIDFGVTGIFEGLISLD